MCPKRVGFFFFKIQLCFFLENKMMCVVKQPEEQKGGVTWGWDEGAVREKEGECCSKRKSGKCRLCEKSGGCSCKGNSGPWQQWGTRLQWRPGSVAAAAAAAREVHLTAWQALKTRSETCGWVLVPDNAYEAIGSWSRIWGSFLFGFPCCVVRILMVFDCVVHSLAV